MTRSYIRIFIIILLCSIYNTNGQTTIDTNALKPKFGVYGQYGLAFHFADFAKLPNTLSCCGGFSTEIGPTFGGGLVVDIPIDYDYIIDLRAGFSQVTGNFYSEINTDVLVDGNLQQGVFSYNLNSNVSKIDFDALLSYRIAENVFLNGGPSFGLLLSSDYKQWEQIEQPSDRGVFPGEGRVRNQYEGEIQNLSSLIFGLTVGIDYQLPLNKKNSLFIVPGLYYSHKFNNIVSDLAWNISELKAGVAVKYRTPPAPPPPPPPPANPIMPDSLPLPINPPALKVFVDAVSVDSNGRINKEPKVQIEDFVSINMRPLLNYVFFDDSSSTIPRRYNQLAKNEAMTFDTDNLKGKNAIETYYDVMNIVGNRMKENLSAKITLVGCNSNIGPELDNKSLSNDRAMSVKNYLTNVWGIEPNRIDVQARNLPIEASKSDTLPGQEENRRVEILSSDESIIKPVMTTDTLRVLSDTDIKFLADVDSEVGINEWVFEAKQDNNILFQKIGTGQPDAELLWDLRNDKKNMPRSASPIEYKLSVMDSVGQRGFAEKSLPINKLTVNTKRENRTDDKEFEYYSLILFSYGKSSLEQEHREVVDFVKNRITDKAKVYVYGYSDSMGEEDINKKISERRAKSVANRLRLRDAEVKGLGEERLLYDNDLPEGRFYCRTVQITVETPVKDI
jgi:outer membrane protein OmpA-like peptidoglycan-associated protein